jgi:hypothetical protein
MNNVECSHVRYIVECSRVDVEWADVIYNSECSRAMWNVECSPVTYNTVASRTVRLVMTKTKTAKIVIVQFAYI